MGAININITSRLLQVRPQKKGPVEVTRRHSTGSSWVGTETNPAPLFIYETAVGNMDRSLYHYIMMKGSIHMEDEFVTIYIDSKYIKQK